jgi:hypothetical protein
VSTGQQGANYTEARTGAADKLRDAVPRLRRLPDEDPSPEQIAIYRSMTPGRRLEIAEQLYWSARRWKTAGVRAAHPAWSEAEIAREVTRIFTNARS